MSPSLGARLVFTHPFGEREAYEAEARGYLGIAEVELPGRGRIPVVFYDTTRLQQDLEEEVRAGSPYIGEPGLIVVKDVTRSNMEEAVRRLYDAGFFKSFRGSDDPI